ncbi:MAG TPA: biotin-dependent carboxyltransferase family protein [Chloroflexia bacterium]
MLEVVSPGLLSTVQDAGRTGYADLGVPGAGACDPHALAVANLLLDNPPGAPALEITIAGPEFTVDSTCVIALAGADLGAHLVEAERPLAPGGAYLLRGGVTLAFAGRDVGARAYLSLPGGIAVPPVLGSASTYLAGGFGGLDGRPLRAGDTLRPVQPGDFHAAGRRWPAPSLLSPFPLREGGRGVRPVVTVRLVPGPHAHHFAPDALETLLAATWEVGPQSDRMGLRLRGPVLLHSAPARAELVSQGIVWGALQVPADGQPIALLADHQTVGGYPVLAVAIRADWPLLAQLPPGAPVRFALTTIAEAQVAYRAQQVALRSAAARLQRPELWARLLAGTE